MSESKQLRMALAIANANVAKLNAAMDAEREKIKNANAAILGMEPGYIAAKQEVEQLARELKCLTPLTPAQQAVMDYMKGGGLVRRRGYYTMYGGRYWREDTRKTIPEPVVDALKYRRLVKDDLDTNRLVLIGATP